MSVLTPTVKYRFIRDYQTSPIKTNEEKLYVIPEGTEVQGKLSGNLANDTAVLNFTYQGKLFSVSIGRNTPVRQIEKKFNTTASGNRWGVPSQNTSSTEILRLQAKNETLVGVAGGIATIGGLAGLFLAIYNKKSGWTKLGWFLLGFFTFSTVSVLVIRPKVIKNNQQIKTLKLQ